MIESRQVAVVGQVIVSGQVIESGQVVVVGQVVVNGHCCNMNTILNIPFRLAQLLL